MDPSRSGHDERDPAGSASEREECGLRSPPLSEPAAAPAGLTPGGQAIPADPVADQPPPIPSNRGVHGGELVHRHRIATRLWHWINAVTVPIMLMSGFMISNAHPHLYWGEYGANADRPWWSPPRFPGWITIPSHYSLAEGRHWHLFFAWIFAFGLLGYMVTSLLNRHFRRDLALSRREVAPDHLWQDVRDHLRLKFPTGQEALSYNVLQKMAYIAVVFGLLPVMIVSGLSLSPGFDAVLHLPLDLVGGRASARSIHFVFAGLIAAFILVHLALVLLAGPYNEVRSMVTGRFRVPPDPDEEQTPREHWLPQGLSGALRRRFGRRGQGRMA